MTNNVSFGNAAIVGVVAAVLGDVAANQMVVENPARENLRR